MTLENRPENEKSPEKNQDRPLDWLFRDSPDIAFLKRKVKEMETPYWVGPGYRGEYTCPHGVGHGRHVHGCCDERCCQRDDFPLNDANLEATRAKEGMQKHRDALRKLAGTKGEEERDAQHIREIESELGRDCYGQG